MTKKEHRYKYINEARKSKGDRKLLIIAVVLFLILLGLIYLAAGLIHSE